MQYLDFNSNNDMLMAQITELFNNMPKLNSVYSSVSYFLNILLYFPKIEFCAYFNLNTSTYEFEHFETLPNQYEVCAKDVFEHLTTNGTVGSAVLERNIALDLENSYETIFLVAPLISFNNITGLVILSLKEFDNTESNYSFSINMLCNQFANKIENLSLLENISNFEKSMEQNIAERTMNLLKSKADMHEKFAELRKNLTMSLPHEIRTPIGMIAGNTDMLVNYIKDLSSAEIVDIAKDIQTSAKRINRLFENYIYFANLELIAIDPIALEKLHSEKMDSYDYIINDIVYARTLKYDRVDDVVVNLVQADILATEIHFTKMMDEIIDNALKYSDKGTPVTIESFLIDNKLMIVITDHGRGLTKDQIENIDAYIQFERKEYEQQGMGLGLAIARRISDLHNGDITFESEYGNYLKVSITMQIAK